MSKKKMRMMGMVLAGVLALVPFMHGCASGDDAANTDNGNQNATEQQQQNPSDQGNSGDQSEPARYGQVMAVNGDEITVMLGDLKDAQDGSGKTFAGTEDEITFNKGDVVVVNESGAVMDAPEFNADDVIVMNGTGEGTDFRPSKVEILDVADSGVNADDAQVPPTSAD